MAHFESISTRVFKKDPIVTWRIIHRPFDIPRANTLRNFGDSIHARKAFRPKRYPVFVGDMCWRLRNAKKLRSRFASGFKLQPSFDGYSLGKTQGW